VYVQSIKSEEKSSRNSRSRILAIWGYE